MTVTPVERGYALVAIDGSEEGYAAATFAAREARSRGLDLQVVHVMPAYLPIGPLLLPTPEEGLGAYASETLASAARIIAEVAPELAVTTKVVAGGRVTQIVHAARGAELVVVGRRPASALDRAWSGGTLDGVVSRARCPVVVVPETRHSEGRLRRVVAAFKSGDHAAELFEAAFRAAHELGGELDVIHAWKLASGYDDIIASRVSEARANHDQKQAIRELLSTWQESYPDVPVRIQVLHEYPVRALVQASRDADRVVLVKPLHGGAMHHLGRTARGVLRFARCPVEVVPAKPAQELTMPPVDLESAGELVR